ncbi:MULTISPECIES: fimbrial protein [Providencia]|uniref:fimbrial protein n=1 Tax=Providencia TaxID=586 RepID=UPI0012B53B97|nr:MULTISPECIES: fimbrial protein [Providencia]MTC56826.1 type 1 fimbrial protein [Providencia rustigianii]
MRIKKKEVIFLLPFFLILMFSRCSFAKNSMDLIMQGSIMDTACAINTGSYEQSIDMGVLPLSLIKNQGQGQAQDFFITLIGCKLTSYTGELWKTFDISFEGPVNGNWFSVSGSAQGVALSLTDSAGESIYPGGKLLPKNIKSGNNILNYQFKIVSDRTPLRAGEYQASIRFKLDYY